jgi:hypothetical protein
MSAPEKIYHVSQTQLSIARHYGGCTFNGHSYTYNPADDSLTRDDVLKTEAKAKAVETAGETKRNEKLQSRMFA